MRFRSIESYKKAWSGHAIPEHVDNLVNDFGVNSCQVCNGHKFSMVERFLTEGNATPDYDYDFGEFGYPAIDHAVFLKRADGLTFVLTMPYGTPEFFCECFNGLLSEYQARKLEIRTAIEEGFGREYKYKRWRKLIYSDAAIQAVVVDNRYKVRDNGSIVAIIATEDTLHEIGLANV